MRFPHTVYRYSGLVLLTNGIMQHRIKSIQNALGVLDIHRADRILKDTIRLFRTARNCDMDSLTHEYVFSQLLHLGIEIRLGKMNDVVCRLANIYTCVSLPETLW